jgi:multiple sugar transport system permease protein
VKTKKKTIERGRYGMLFIAPFFIIFLIFQFYPLLYTFATSFTYTYRNGRNTVTDPGFSLGSYVNYVFGAAGGGEVWQALAVTIALWILNFIPQIVLSLLLAAWFTDAANRLKPTGFYKVVMYLPNIITAATIAVLFYNLFGGHGAIKAALDAIGIHINVDKGWTSFAIIAFIQFWMWYGNTMIVLIAGILGISPSIYEAARVDGATGRQQFFMITIPMLKPILQYTLVTSAIGGLQMYDIPQLFNEGGPVVKVGNTNVNSTTTIVMLIKKYVSAGNTQNYGRASAYSIVLFVITLAISMIFYKLTAEKKPKKSKGVQK